jgi:competence protein ComEC
MDDWKKNVKWLVLLVLLIVCAATQYLAFRNEKGNFRIVFLNVGQGDAIYIEAPNGNQMLIDGGATNAVLRELSAVMPWFDRSIDVVLATHSDADHIGGLVDVYDRYAVRHYIDNGATNDTAPYFALESAVEKEGGERLVARRGMRIDLGSGVSARVLFPDRSMEGVETNTGSIVLKLEYGEHSFLLTGDSPSAIEDYLVSLNANDLDVDVLKLGHHGSRTSTSALFVEAASPDVAVISAGKDNRYGHPHREVLQTLEQFGVKSRSTAEEGRIEFRY